MLIEKRTQAQIDIQKLIIRELIKRPQMAIWVLAWILDISETETSELVNDLEYRWSIEGRISRNYLIEREAINIKLIQDEISKRLWSDNVAKLTLSDLQEMLEAVIERARDLEWWNNKNEPDRWNHTYIENLLNLPFNPNTNDKVKTLKQSWEKNS